MHLFTLKKHLDFTCYIKIKKQSKITLVNVGEIESTTFIQHLDNFTSYNEVIISQDYSIWSGHRWQLLTLSISIRKSVIDSGSDDDKRHSILY
jgi:hypothetical protein